MIESDVLTYDKRSGDFHVPGPGVVYYYNREGQAGSLLAPDAPAAPPNQKPNPGCPRGRVLPTGLPARGPVVVGRNGADRPPAAAGAAAKGKGRAAPAVAPLKLTQIRFSDQMKGRLLMGKSADPNAPLWADFFGNVVAINAPVSGTSQRIKPDALPRGFSYMTSQTLRVVSEPPPRSPEDAPERLYLTAWDDASATRETAKPKVAPTTTSIQADKITYDSLKELYYAYAAGGPRGGPLADAGSARRRRSRGAGPRCTTM